MIRFLFGTWKGRILTIAAIGLSFVLSMTVAMTVAIGKSGDVAEKAQRVPLLGKIAVLAAERIFGASEAPAVEPDIQTVREMRPLSSEEIGQLIADLKIQRQVYIDRMALAENEIKRIEIARKDLAREREEINAMRQEIGARWEEIQKARSNLEKQVTEIQSLEMTNLKQLATSYESMKPDRAAEIFKKLDEATAVKTLHLMRERSAAKVIENLDQDTAVRLSERLALVKQSN